MNKYLASTHFMRARGSLGLLAVAVLAYSNIRMSSPVLSSQPRVFEDLRIRKDLKRQKASTAQSPSRSRPRFRNPILIARQSRLTVSSVARSSGSGFITLRIRSCRSSWTHAERTCRERRACIRSNFPPRPPRQTLYPIFLESPIALQPSTCLTHACCKRSGG